MKKLRAVWILLAVTLFAPAVLAAESQLVHSENNSIWVNDFSLDIRHTESRVDVESHAARDQNCYNTTFKIQKYRFTNRWIENGYAERAVCATNTAFGAISLDGYVHFSGTQYAQRIVRSGDQPIAVTAFAGQKQILLGGGRNWSTNTPNKAYFINNLVSIGKSVVSGGGERVFRIDPLPPELKDESGNTLGISDVYTSGNGQWMVAVVKNVLMRIHVPTNAMQTFTKGSYGNGISHAMGISNDGRYVYEQYVQHMSAGNAYIYDLSGCTANHQYTLASNVVEGCSRRDITSLLRSSITEFRFLGNVRFSPDGTRLIALARYWKTTDFVAPSGQKYVEIYKSGYMQPPASYIALGDSFASGEGENVGNIYYEPGTDEKENLCHLSRRSYAYLIAQQLTLINAAGTSPHDDSPFHSIACSGAKIINITGGSGLGGKNPDNQFSVRPSNSLLGLWLPGYFKQEEFLEKNKPTFITISIGGNDVGFADKLIECVASKFKVPIPGTCKYASDPVERANMAKEIAEQFTELKDTYSQLAQTTQNKTRIFVTSYPQFVNPGGKATCGLNVGMNPEERQFVYEGTKYMNQVIQAAAKAAGVYYVDIEESLAGYNLCSDVADKEMAVNGITKGNDQGFLLKFIANESFHPNHNGHLRMKNAIMSQLENQPETFLVCPKQPEKLTCPEENIDVPIPGSYFGDTANSYVQWLNAPALLPPSTLAPINTSLIYETVITDRKAQVTLENLKPSSTAEIIIKSTPTSIGQFTVDNDGRLDAIISVPDDIKPGFHTVHVLATNLAEQPRDYYQHVLVAGPEDDINGNGIPDGQDKCGFVEAADIDTDKDGTDDACDGFLGNIPGVDQEIPSSLDQQEPVAASPSTTALYFDNHSPNTQPAVLNFSVGPQTPEILAVQATYEPTSHTDNQTGDLASTANLEPMKSLPAGKLLTGLITIGIILVVLKIYLRRRWP